MTATPDELRAAADAFARIGSGRVTGEDVVADVLADADALVSATLRGDKAEAERIKARMAAFADAHPDDDDEDDDDLFDDDDPTERDDLHGVGS